MQIFNLQAGVIDQFFAISRLGIDCVGILHFRIACGQINRITNSQSMDNEMRINRVLGLVRSDIIPKSARDMNFQWQAKGIRPYYVYGIGPLSDM